MADMKDDAATRQELRSLAERYAQSVDRRDADTFVALFHDDATIIIHDPSESTEPREIRGIDRLAKIPEVIKQYPKTFHLLGQSTYDIIGDGEGRGEVYCIAHHLSHDDAAGTTNFVMYIRYEDTYRTDAGGAWKFAQRRLRVDWTEARAANPPTH
jgi:ketosteroid isomerase-like protein